MSKHLDLGCGGRPRNPYGREELFGVDIQISGAAPPGIVAANLAVDRIPFPNHMFESVSAFDFLEHVPRVLNTSDGRSTRLPFVELMDEVWRVLKPGGLLYASTPVFPSETSLVDPTHVNYLTARTHEYFCAPQRRASIYGFKGAFVARRIQLARPNAATLYVPPTGGLLASLKYGLNKRIGRFTHIIWELEAAKDAQ